MRADLILDSLEYVDASLIEHADRFSPRKRRSWKAWAIAAACFCLVIGGAILFRGQRADAPSVQQWSASMGAGAYFRNSGKPAQGAASPASFATLVMPPCAMEVSRSDERGALEAEGVLPEMPEHTEHSFRAAYNGDGSLYKVVFWYSVLSTSMTCCCKTPPLHSATITLLPARLLTCTASRFSSM